MAVEQLFSAIDESREEIVRTMVEMLRIPAIGPENGGEGELPRATFLEERLHAFGFTQVERYDAPDERVPSGRRPNIVARVRGRSSRMIWFIAHMDTVPPGDLTAWESPPFEPLVREGRIYGRGSEDNGQGLISALFAARAFLTTGVVPEWSIGLVFVADEECGNVKGIDHVIAQGIFSAGDLILVPDYGKPEGDVVEVAEKSLLWLKFTIHGVQAHASTPQLGLNAMEVASELIVSLAKTLRRKYPNSSSLFEPATSTFSPTKREANVPNVNTIPGLDVFYFDCRVLPEVPLDEVLKVVRGAVRRAEKRSGAKISVEIVQRSDSAPALSPDAEVVQLLSEAVGIVRGHGLRPVGIGGGTCATPVRRIGLPAAVWLTCEHLAHQVNESCGIDNLLTDAKVYAALLSRSPAGAPSGTSG